MRIERGSPMLHGLFLLVQLTSAYPPEVCPGCAEWNAPAPGVRLFGNTYYVGTRGLSAILVTGSEGHILLDGGLPESAPVIMKNIRDLGFRVEDIKLILNSHPHYDHAGGIAALVAASGAPVAASPRAAPVLLSGRSGTDDPQYGVVLGFPPVDHVRVIADGDTLRVGSLAIAAHFTPGHTPGGTSWSWRSCQGGQCRDLVYADSQNPISADGFLFSRSTTYPGVMADFEKGFTVLEGIRCDLLLTPHPGTAHLWERLAAREHGDSLALVDPAACRRYAGETRERLAKRVAAEAARPDIDAQESRYPEVRFP
ncbi:MAG TPA: subclass B3 metallo-beta-lactamase [Gemmatimonadales bacterium]|nr:subclass B3 metallo-beta-lactamase [Gemmatimonadales bacterium]